jgi:hypothetical protein
MAAIVLLAALRNASHVVGKPIESLKVVNTASAWTAIGCCVVWATKTEYVTVRRFSLRYERDRLAGGSHERGKAFATGYTNLEGTSGLLRDALRGPTYSWCRATASTSGYRTNGMVIVLPWLIQSRRLLRGSFQAAPVVGTTKHYPNQSTTFWLPGRVRGRSMREPPITAVRNWLQPMRLLPGAETPTAGRLPSIRTGYFRSRLGSGSAGGHGRVSAVRTRTLASRGPFGLWGHAAYRDRNETPTSCASTRPRLVLGCLRDGHLLISLFLAERGYRRIRLAR